jgi:hypothetical protein
MPSSFLVEFRSHGHELIVEKNIENGLGGSYNERNAFDLLKTFLKE